MGRKISTNRDYRLWFYGIRFRNDFNELLERHGGIDAIMQQKIDEFNENIEQIIKYWVSIRFTLYDAYYDWSVVSSSINSSGEIRKVIGRIGLIDNITSHYAMRMIAAAYPPVADYIIDMETKLFMKIIESSKSYKFMTENGLRGYDHIVENIFRAIFGDDFEGIEYTYENEERIVHKRVKKSVAKISWTAIGDIAADWDSYYMNHGVIFIPSEKYPAVISRKFRELLAEEFKKYAESISDRDVSPYKDIVEDIFSDIVESRVFTPHTEDIDEIIADSPLCIQHIDSEIQNGVSISYQYALQLSFYMKSFFNVDGLANYWWRRDRRNRGYATLEDFKSGRRDLMYHFNHQYGMGGSSTDYRPMKCRTCQSGDRYCFFTSSPRVIERELRRRYSDMYSDDPQKLAAAISRILKLVASRRYGMACSIELALRLKTSLKVINEWKGIPMRHPLYQYYHICSSIRNGLEPPKDHPNLRGRNRVTREVNT